MNCYRVNCAIVYPACYGLIGIAVGLAHVIFDIHPLLTPILCDLFSWWPSDVVLSGCLIGMSIGVMVAGAMIILHLRQQAIFRDIFQNRFR